MTAGVLFGVVPGAMVVSVSSTAAATIAFLIARYAARDRILVRLVGVGPNGAGGLAISRACKYWFPEGMQQYPAFFK